MCAVKCHAYFDGGDGATRPFRGMWAQRNSAETQQLCHTSGSGLTVENRLYRAKYRFT